MAFDELSESVDELKTNIKAYAHSNAEYYKLKAFKQGMKGATSLVRFLILGFLLSVAGIMISFALAIVISQSIGVASSGYFIIGGIYLIIAVLIFLFAKQPIEKLLIEKFSKVVFEDKNKDKEA